MEENVEGRGSSRAAGRSIVRLRGSKRHKNWRALSPTESTERENQREKEREIGWREAERNEELCFIAVELTHTNLRHRVLPRKERGVARWTERGQFDF